MSSKLAPRKKFKHNYAVVHRKGLIKDQSRQYNKLTKPTRKTLRSIFAEIVPDKLEQKAQKIVDNFHTPTALEGILASVNMPGKTPQTPKTPKPTKTIANKANASTPSNKNKANKNKANKTAAGSVVISDDNIYGAFRPGKRADEAEDRQTGSCTLRKGEKGRRTTQTKGTGPGIQLPEGEISVFGKENERIHTIRVR